MSANTDFLDLSGSFIINDFSRMQSLYSSQNYGTFYEVYALCNFENDLLKSIDLKLVNYKGPINIGFLNKLGGNCKLKFDLKSKTLCLILVVKGLGNYDSTTITVNENVPIDEIDEFNTYRLLMPLNVNSDGLENNVFDEEYYYRSGISTIDSREKRDGLLKADLDIDSIDCFELTPKGDGGGKCYSSKKRCIRKL